MPGTSIENALETCDFKMQDAVLSRYTRGAGTHLAVPPAPTGVPVQMARRSCPDPAGGTV